MSLVEYKDAVGNHVSKAGEKISIQNVVVGHDEHIGILVHVKRVIVGAEFHLLSFLLELTHSI